MEFYFVLVLIFLFGSTEAFPVSSRDTTFQSLTAEVENLKQTVASLQMKFNTHVSRNMPVSFSVGLSKTITNMGSKQHIVFDNVITNVGNGYNSFSGHFKAPVSGVYAFFIVITNIPKHSCSVRLLRNGHFIGQVLANGKNTVDLYLTSTIAVTAQLQKGDQVWVQNEYAYSSVEQMDGGNWSMFSGHLISAN